MSRAVRSTVLRGLGFLVVLEAMLVPAILFWPNFRETLEENSGVVRTLASISIVREMVNQIEAVGVMAYVTLQHFFKACNTLGVAATVLFAMGAIAGEAHRGTLELFLARPVSRKRLLLERWTAGALAVIVPVLATTATIPWLLGFVDESLRAGPLMLCAVHQCILLLASYSVTFLFSTLGSNPTRIAFAMLFFFIFEFSVYMVKEVTHYSLFRLADVEKFKAIYDRGGLDWTICGPTLAVALIALVASLIAFERRVP